jgi:hypothetical protein
MSISCDLLLSKLEDDLHAQPNFLASKKREFSEASKQLIVSIFKKNADIVDCQADAKAIDKFVKINDDCLNFKIREERMLDSYLLGELKSTLYKFFEPAWGRQWFDLFDAFCIGDVGPGSSIMADGTSFFKKMFSSTLSMTDHSLYTNYVLAIKSNPIWHEAEIVRLAKFGNSIVQASKLVCVPKTNEISRVICVEPSLNMYVQKGVQSLLEARLRSFFKIDLSTQANNNRHLARLGSSDGRFSTIDLSSASDSISLVLAREILPSWIFKILLKIRCPNTILPDGSLVQLHMLSSMGNATTFPLQTIIFCAMVFAAYKLDEKHIVKPNGVLGNYAVFGDDIIVEASAYAKIIRCLELCGFTVNKDKTFSTGLFRESCGADYYNGSNVRGVYCKSLKTKHDRYVLLNKLNQWCCNQGAVLPRTIRYLARSVPRQYVPMHESDDAGIQVPLTMAANNPRMGMGSVKYWAYKPFPKKISVLQFSESSEINLSYGSEVAAVKGSLRDGYLIERQNVVKYRLISGTTPCWDSTGWIPGRFVQGGENNISVILRFNLNG